MTLTKHFTLEEFTRSSTAKARGIDNTVPEKLIPELRNLCVTVLEPLREQAKEPGSTGDRSVVLRKNLVSLVA